MLSGGQAFSIKFFNSLLHGLDTSYIIRMNVSPLESLAGVFQTFIIGWLIGASIAAIYNTQIKSN
jgi:hypothetical protein